MTKNNGSDGEQSQTPNTRGWVAPWTGTWGNFSDGRTRVSRRKAKYLQMLLQEYGAVTPSQWARAVRISELLAQADKVKTTMGNDARSTLRAWTSLLKLAGNEEARLRASVAGREAVTDPLESLLR